MKYAVANWKMNMEENEITSWQDFFEIDSRKLKNTEVIIAPSYPYLDKIKYFKVAAQDVSAYDEGAHTQEVSADQLEDFCDYCIVGHSEIGDSTEIKKLKISQCLKHNMIPIVCFENSAELPQLLQPGIIVAWEDTKNISDADGYKKLNLEAIKSELAELKNVVPYTTPVLYGGSVNATNIRELAAMDIDGVLVGHASTDPVEFTKIVEAFE